MKKLVGLLGQTGAGKDTFCDYVRKNCKGVFCFRFSDPLSETLKIYFDGVKKEDQQWLATVLRERFGNNILGEAIAKKIRNIRSGLVLVNGLRVPEEFNLIKKLGGKIIYISAPPKIRWERVRMRGEKKDDVVSYKKFLEMEKAETEIHISKMAKKADFIINNGGTKQQLHRQIKILLQN